MNINFEKKDGTYQAEVKLSDASAIHVERIKDGSFVIEQRHSTSGQYAPLFNDNKKFNTPVIDFTVKDDAYPICLKLTSSSEVVFAEGSENVQQICTDGWFCIIQDFYDVQQCIPFFKDANGVLHPICYQYGIESEGSYLFTDILYYIDNEYKWSSELLKEDPEETDFNPVQFDELKQQWVLFKQLTGVTYSLCSEEDVIESTEDTRASFVEVKDTCEQVTIDF